MLVCVLIVQNDTSANPEQEIFTNTVPYAEYRTDGGVYGAIKRKQVPRKPGELSGTDEPTVRMWGILVECWDHNPAARPNAATVLRRVRTNLAPY